MKSPIDPLAVYALWHRDVLRFRRSRSRIVGVLAAPVFVVAFLGVGFSGVQFRSVPEGVTYLQYLVPGVLGFTALFSASFTGLSVLSDREVGFLKEILVAPVPRVSVVLGRVLGGATTGLLQALLIFLATLALGFRPVSVSGTLLAGAYLLGIAVTFVGFGIALAAGFEDSQGYQLLVNFVLFPLGFLSGAFYPLDNLPGPVAALGYLNPLTYGVDGLRGALVGPASAQFPLWVDAAALLASGTVTVLAGAVLFERVDGV